MRIGVPNEIKCNEFRVGLVPGSVRELTAAGHEVIVETGAGDGIIADDAAYEKAGATIVPDAAEAVFAEAEMIVKVKEPQAEEWIAGSSRARFSSPICILRPIRSRPSGLIESGARRSPTRP